MIPLTAQQAQLLDYLRSCERAPSMTEMRDALGTKSMSTVHRLVIALVDRGFIERRPGAARCIRVLDVPRTLDTAALHGFGTADLVAELARRGVTSLEGARA